MQQIYQYMFIIYPINHLLFSISVNDNPGNNSYPDQATLFKVSWDQQIMPIYNYEKHDFLKI